MELSNLKQLIPIKWPVLCFSTTHETGNINLEFRCSINTVVSVAFFNLNYSTCYFRPDLRHWQSIVGPNWICIEYHWFKHNPSYTDIILNISHCLRNIWYDVSEVGSILSSGVWFWLYWQVFVATDGGHLDDKETEQGCGLNSWGLR